LTKIVNITKYKDGLREATADEIVEESIIALTINNKDIFYINCLASNLKEMTVGFMLFKGFIDHFEDIREMTISPKGDIFAYTQNFTKGRRVKAKRRKGLDYQRVIKALEISNSYASDLKRTGGVHSATLLLGNGESITFEDIKRHNAVDKVVGYVLMNGLDTFDSILFISARISAEITLKAAKLGVAVLISKSAVTSLSIDIAREHDLALIGFARGGRLNIYN